MLTQVIQQVLLMGQEALFETFEKYLFVTFYRFLSHFIVFLSHFIVFCHRFFSRSVDFIDEAVKQGGIVVVNCVMGW